MDFYTTQKTNGIGIKLVLVQKYYLISLNQPKLNQQIKTAFKVTHSAQVTKFYSEVHFCLDRILTE